MVSCNSGGEKRSERKSSKKWIIILKFVITLFSEMEYIRGWRRDLSVGTISEGAKKKLLT